MSYKWRDTYKRPKFFFVDARLSFIILLTLIHIRLWTLAITIACAAFLYYFEKRRNMGLVSALRMIRAWFAGYQRPGTIYSKSLLPIDYGRIMMSSDRYKSAPKPRKKIK